MKFLIIALLGESMKGFSPFMNKVSIWGPPLLWLVVISLFSTDSFSSQHTQTWITRLIVHLWIQTPPLVIPIIDFYVRKSAHFIEYAALSFLWMRAFRLSGYQLLPSVLGTLLVSVVWAGADEIHQSFVPSRTPALRDVLIDISGGLVGLLIGLFLFSLRGKLETLSSSSDASQNR